MGPLTRLTNSSKGLNANLHQGSILHLLYSEIIMLGQRNYNMVKVVTVSQITNNAQNKCLQMLLSNILMNYQHFHISVWNVYDTPNNSIEILGWKYFVT